MLLRSLAACALVCCSIATSAIAQTQVVRNPGFEGTGTGSMNRWTRIAGPSGGIFGPASGSAFGIDPYAGSFMAGAPANWDTTKNGAYIYQTITNTYSGLAFFSAWGIAENFDAPNNATRVRFGVDPTGGIDWAAATVIKSTAIQATGIWENRTMYFNATGNDFTVFAYIVHGNHEWNLTYVDNINVMVPEPGGILALGAGLVGMGGVFFRKRTN